MDTAKKNYWIDIVMLVSIIGSGITGLILFFALPSGQRSGYEYFLGIIKRTWSGMHEWAGLIFIAAALIHIILHWKWLIAMTKNLFKKSK